MAAGNKEAAYVLQRHVVARVPVDMTTSPSRVRKDKHRVGDTKKAFADPEAVGISRQNKNKGGWSFGLRNKRLKNLGFLAPWLEFGTKGYKKGDVRTYQQRREELRPTFSKNGKRIGRPALQSRIETRKRSIDRNVPARPAQPFFRPGINAAWREIERIWQEALVRAVNSRR